MVSFLTSHWIRHPYAVSTVDRSRIPSRTRSPMRSTAPMYRASLKPSGESIGVHLGFCRRSAISWKSEKFRSNARRNSPRATFRAPASCSREPSSWPRTNHRPPPVTIGVARAAMSTASVKSKSPYLASDAIPPIAESHLRPRRSISTGRWISLPVRRSIQTRLTSLTPSASRRPGVSQGMGYCDKVTGAPARSFRSNLGLHRRRGIWWPPLSDWMGSSPRPPSRWRPPISPVMRLAAARSPL